MDLKVLLSISLAVFAQILEVDSVDCCSRSSATLFQTKWRLLAFDRLPASAKVELVSALLSHVTNDDVIDAVRVLYPTASGSHEKVELSSHDATRILSFCDGIVNLLKNKRSLDQHLLHVIKSWPTEAAQIYSKLHSIKQALKSLFVNDLSNHDSSSWPLACLDGVFHTVSEKINQTVLRATCKLTKSSGDPAVPVEGVVNFARNCWEVQPKCSWISVDSLEPVEHRRPSEGSISTRLETSEIDAWMLDHITTLTGTPTVDRPMRNDMSVISATSKWTRAVTSRPPSKMTTCNCMASSASSEDRLSCIRVKMIWVRVVSPTAKQPDTREEDWGAVSLNGYGKIPSDPKILYTNAGLSTELENWNL